MTRQYIALSTIGVLFMTLAPLAFAEETGMPVEATITSEGAMPARKPHPCKKYEGNSDKLRECLRSGGQGIGQQVRQVRSNLQKECGASETAEEYRACLQGAKNTFMEQHPKAGGMQGRTHEIQNKMRDRCGEFERGSEEQKACMKETMGTAKDMMQGKMQGRMQNPCAEFEPQSQEQKDCMEKMKGTMKDKMQGRMPPPPCGDFEPGTEEHTACMNDAKGKMKEKMQGRMQHPCAELEPQSQEQKDCMEKMKGTMKDKMQGRMQDQMQGKPGNMMEGRLQDRMKNQMQGQPGNSGGRRMHEWQWRNQQ